MRLPSPEVTRHRDLAEVLQGNLVALRLLVGIGRVDVDVAEAMQRLGGDGRLAHAVVRCALVAGGAGVELPDVDVAQRERAEASNGVGHVVGVDAIVALDGDVHHVAVGPDASRAVVAGLLQFPGLSELLVADALQLLWEIARRCYGDGSRFVEIFEASRGLPMEGGEHFSDPRVIRPGWVLRVPLPALNVDAGDDVTTYRVRRGDHLWGIAERFLGDGFRWIEIWEHNSGREVDAGSRLTDPNQIHPGWLLELPLRDGEAALRAEARAPAAPPAPLPVESAVRPAFADAMAGAATRAGTVAAGDADADAGVADGGGGWDWEWPQVPRTVTWSAAGFAVIGGTAIFVQRLHRGGRLRFRPGGGRGGDGPGDAGRVALATGALGTALADLGFAGSMPLLVLEGGSVLEFTVACPPGDAGALLAARHDLERRLGCDVEAAAHGPTRVALTLGASGRPPGGLGEAPYASPALVVPVGATDAGVVYLNLAAAGSVTVTGPAGERRARLRSWVATLQTTCSPDQLSFRVDSAAAGLLDADEGLLYFGDAAGAHGAADLADELDEIIQSRNSGHGMSRPLVAVFDLTGSGDDVPAGAMRHGPAAGSS